MITVLEMDGATNKGTVGCREHMKLLKIIDSQDPLGDEAMELLMSTAVRHEQLHPQHVLTVTVYKKPDIIK